MICQPSIKEIRGVPSCRMGFCLGAENSGSSQMIVPTPIRCIEYLTHNQTSSSMVVSIKLTSQTQSIIHVANWPTKSFSLRLMDSDKSRIARILYLTAASCPWRWKADRASIASRKLWEDKDVPESAFGIKTVLKPFRLSSIVVIMRDRTSWSTFFEQSSKVGSGTN